MCTTACKYSLSNTGEVSCPSIFDFTTTTYLMPLVGSSGNLNKIDISAFQANPKTYIEGLINASDGLDRIYPVTGLKEVEDVRAEPVFETFADGSKIFIKEGIRTFNCVKPKVSARWIKNANGVRCSPKFGVFFVTDSKQIVGKKISDTDLDLYPIEVVKESFYAGLVKGTPTTSQKAQITFDISQYENDGDLAMIPSSEMGTLIPSAVNGLLDVVSSSSSISTTGFTLTLGVIDSNIVANVPVTGLVVGDLALYNVTDAASITPTSMTETSDGVYVIVMPAQTSADVIRVTLTKNGYDFTAVTANTVLIP